MHQRVDFANTLRGLAAVSVLISHYCGVFWYSPDVVAGLIKSGPIQVDGVPFYVQWLQIPNFNWGAFGVALFFLVSGFVISASLGKMTAGAFLKNRIFRILPTYAAGFLICLVAIRYNVEQNGGSWPFSTKTVLIHFIPGLRDIFGTTGIDGIVWTLEIEVKFYLVCALMAPLFATRSPWVFAAPVILATAVLLSAKYWMPGFDILLGRMMFSAQFIVFMFAGSAFYYGYSGALPERQATLLAALLVALFVFTWYVYPLGIPFFSSINYVVAFFMFWIAYTFPNMIPKNKVTDFFADISYPLYVVHGVAGYTLLAVLRDMGVSSSLALTITTGAAISIAYAIHIFVEVPTRYWGREPKLPEASAE
jgi:peptidoglycan/LPS O-acetylase OafA/YrhL